jgi:hypothetical protein
MIYLVLVNDDKGGKIVNVGFGWVSANRLGQN